MGQACGSLRHCSFAADPSAEVKPNGQGLCSSSSWRNVMVLLQGGCIVRRLQLSLKVFSQARREGAGHQDPSACCSLKQNKGKQPPLSYLQSSMVPPGDQVPSGQRRQMPVPVAEPYPLLHLSQTAVQYQHGLQLSPSKDLGLMQAAGQSAYAYTPKNLCTHTQSLRADGVSIERCASVPAGQALVV
jgi:hypothetical protein